MRAITSDASAHCVDASDEHGLTSSAAQARDSSVTRTGEFYLDSLPDESRRSVALALTALRTFFRSSALAPLLLGASCLRRPSRTIGRSVLLG